MGVLTDLQSASVKPGVRSLYGKILTRPALLVTDGISLTYGCDVDIGPTDSTGRINQHKKSLIGVPGADKFKPDDALTINTVLHNVIIARNNMDLIYANPGNAVIVTRSSDVGQWEITGFATQQPGTYWIIPVNLQDGTIGTVIDQTITIRLLTFGELGTLEPFGVIAFGASALYLGGEFVEYV